MKILRRDHAILLLIIALHGAWFASWTLQRQKVGQAAVRRMDIVWLAAPPPPRRPPATAAAAGRERPHAAPAIREAAAANPLPQPITPPQETPPDTRQTLQAPAADDPFALPPPSGADVVSRAKRDLARIEQELRKGRPPKEMVLQADSTQAKLERGFNAAHDAVPSKWYQGATIKELNSTDPHKKIFRINTALGAYCILVNEEGKRNYVNCPN